MSVNLKRSLILAAITYFFVLTMLIRSECKGYAEAIGLKFHVTWYGVCMIDEDDKSIEYNTHVRDSAIKYYHK